MKFFRKIKYKLFPPKKYYFVATVREEKNYRSDSSEYITHDSRTWGFYTSKKRAIRSVEENWTDMNEDGYYPWAVIGTYNEGLISQCFREPEIWFKESYKEFSTDELKEIEKSCPDKLKDKCIINTKTKRVTWNDGTCWQSNFEGYRRCSTPKWADHVCGWCM